MRSLIYARSLALAALLTAPSFGAIEGVVTNMTSNKPQAGVTVNLVHPGQKGMETLATVTSGADGSFKIEHDVPPPPALLMADFKGVQYNLVIAPGAPSTGLKLNISDTTTNPASAKVAQHVIILQPAADHVQVDEAIMLENDTNSTFQDAKKGSAQFFLPSTVTAAPEITVESSGGMPIRRTAAKTDQANVYKIEYPIKPGGTRFEWSYSMPPATTFKGTVLPGDPLRIATPKSVVLSGDALQDLGQEPQSQAHVYNVTAKGPFEITMTGTVPLPAADGAAPPAQETDDLGQPEQHVSFARVYNRMGLVLGLAFSLLAAGGFLIFRKGAA